MLITYAISHIETPIGFIEVQGTEYCHQIDRLVSMPLELTVKSGS